jgi:hypothetical protein
VIARLGDITFSDDHLPSARGAGDGRRRGVDGGPLPYDRGSDVVRDAGVVREPGAQRYEVDVQELARSGSINGQARWGVRLRGGESAKLPNRSEPVMPAASLAARKKQEKTIARLRGGKLAASASPIKVWDAGEVARELRSGESEKRKAKSENEGGEVGEGLRNSEFGLRIEEKGNEIGSNEQRAANQKGSGLGLALCVELVTRFGGRMSAESVVGEGTTVVVELPVAQARGRRAA